MYRRWKYSQLVPTRRTCRRDNEYIENLKQLKSKLRGSANALKPDKLQYCKWRRTFKFSSLIFQLHSTFLETFETFALGLLGNNALFQNFAYQLSNILQFFYFSNSTTLPPTISPLFSIQLPYALPLLFIDCKHGRSLTAGLNFLNSFLCLNFSIICSRPC